MGEESFTKSSVYKKTFFSRKGSTSRSWFQSVNMGLWFFSTNWRDSRHLSIMYTIRPNAHSSSTLSLRYTTQKSDDGFKAEIWQSWELFQEACTTYLVLDSWFDCPAWQALESRSESPSSKDLGPTPLGSICVPGSPVALRELSIWGAHRTTAGYPEPIESTKDSCTWCGLSEERVEGRSPNSNRVWIWCYILSGDSFVSTLHSTSRCNILIIRETVVICKVIWSWVASITACVDTHLLHYTFFSAHMTWKT